MLAQSVNHVALDKFYPPTISENPAFVFSYCINLGGISQERDFEKSESLLLLYRKLQKKRGCDKIGDENITAWQTERIGGFATT